ncbi:MAG TPA: nucleoside triphosphate pyrophosphohydrolase [Balneolaceae bacterium]|nr:nucleoside triphosphate pyrophosphohydrolase [Balneolaceae bacterium]
MKPSSSFQDFTRLISILRKECPWDRKQTHESLKDNLIEEVYEVVDAIDNRDFDELKKELGDLLLHVVFQAEMASEKSEFTMDDVIRGISEKLIRRHPHVFSDTKAEDDSDVASNWESIKLSEGKSSILDGLPKNLPALIKAHRMQEKAANVGFDWAEWKLAWEKLDEEIDEWRHAVEHQDKAEQKDEFGDLLFSIVNVGRLLDLNAEDSLRAANRKFESRFRFIEEKLAEKNRTVTESDLEEMDNFWNEAKRKGL